MSRRTAPPGPTIRGPFFCELDADLGTGAPCSAYSLESEELPRLRDDIDDIGLRFSDDPLQPGEA